MSASSNIQWTDATWNCVRGCSRVSPGCEHCYAETMAARFSETGQAFHGFAVRSPARWTRKVELVPEMLDLPLHWKKPRRIFVNSMSDLFHESLSESDIRQVWRTMQLAPRHTFQILTKRAARLAELVPKLNEYHRPFTSTTMRGDYDIPPNVWLGVSVEDQQRADERIPHLLQTPAAVRFLSCEPLLGPIDLRLIRHSCYAGPGRPHPECEAEHGPKIDWVIVGGESGTGARAMALAWARSLVEQCRAAGVACFVKQLGARAEENFDGFRGTGFTLKLKDRKGGDIAEFPADLRVRQFPTRSNT